MNGWELYSLQRGTHLQTPQERTDSNSKPIERGEHGLVHQRQFVESREKVDVVDDAVRRLESHIVEVFPVPAGILFAGISSSTMTFKLWRLAFI